MHSQLQLHVELQTGKNYNNTIYSIKGDSEWVKSRNTAYLSILDKADGKALDEIEKAIDKI